MVYTTITTILDHAEQLRSAIQVLTHSVHDLKNGNIGPAVGKIKEVLGSLATVGISFIAKFLKLDKITDHIKGVIGKVEKKIQEVIGKIKAFFKDKIDGFLGGKGGKKKSGSKGKDGEEEDKDTSTDSSGKQIIGKQIKFDTTEGGQSKTHKLYAIAENGSAEVIVRSAPTIVLHKLISWKGEAEQFTKTKKSKALDLITEARKQYYVVKKEAQKSLQKALSEELSLEEDKLAVTLQKLFNLYGEANNLRPVLKEATRIEHNTSGKESKALVTANKKGNPNTLDDMPGWAPEAARLNALSELSKVVWNRGHKISHRLGGDGKNADNLFIITTETNVAMSNSTEQVAQHALKQLIAFEGGFKDKEKYQDRILYYDVNYNSYKAPFYAFPRSIDIEWGTCDINGKNRIILDDAEIENLDPSKVTGHVNINNTSEGPLSKITKHQGMKPRFWIYACTYRRNNDVKYKNYASLVDILTKNRTGASKIGADTLEKQLELLDTLLFDPIENPTGQLIIK